MIGRYARDFDWAMLLNALTICTVGIVQIFSATRETNFQESWWKQIIFMGMGLVLMWIVASIDYHTLVEHSTLLYGVGIVGLLAVLLVGKTVLGGKRWIPLPGG